MSINFAGVGFWPAYTLVGLGIIAFAWIINTSIRKNTVTRAAISSRFLSIMIETKRPDRVDANDHQESKPHPS
jgi:hypothetical protein